VRAFLARNQREVLLVAALPLPHVDARRVVSDGFVHAESDMLGFLQRTGAIETGIDRGADDPYRPAPSCNWLSMAVHRAGTDLPEGAEPPDGLVAGLMATNALARGTFNSIAGRFSAPQLKDVHGTVRRSPGAADAATAPPTSSPSVCAVRAHARRHYLAIGRHRLARPGVALRRRPGG